MTKLTDLEIKKRLFAHKVYILSNGKHGIKLNMEKCDLRGSDLSYSNLSYSDLSGSDLSDSNLSYSNLSGSNLDYSCWGLSCKTLNVKIDKKIAVQLLYHTMRAMQSVDDKECKEFLRNKSNMKLVNQFHRVEECGEIT